MRAGDTVGDRFAIERLAGSGGMGTVYRARDTQSGGAVAVKMLRVGGEEEAVRLSREAHVLRELRHPRIVGYVAHGATANGQPYLVTEWLDGEDLSRRLSREVLGPTEAIALGLRIAEGLGAAHRRGIIHRDVKPSNIFLEGGRLEAVKVLDFGVARVGARGAGFRSLTQTGVMIGTPGYMSPEQARGERQIDARADVFSLGCVLFRCLTGRLPFAGDDLLAVLLKLVLEDAPTPRAIRPDVPAGLDALVGRMLAKAPGARPPDGGAVATALAALEVPRGAEADEGAREPRAEALTDAERRAMCVVLARLGDGAALDDGSDTAPTRVRGAAPAAWVEEPTETDERAALDVAVAPHRGELEVLADGSLLVTVPAAGAFTDQAAQAARAALALRDTLADGAAPGGAGAGAAVVLVSGRGELSARVPLGEVIDRGVALLRREAGDGAGPASTPRPVRIDEAVAGLLSSAFEVRGAAGDLYLVRERDADGARTLLGRATPCVGREREIALLAALFDEVAAEPVARAVRLTGPAGIGKSRLRQELVAAIRARGVPFELWTGRGDPMREGSPFGVLAPALRRAAGILDGEPPAAQRNKLHARVARSAPAAQVARVAEFLAELVGVPPAPGDGDESVVLRAARRDPMLMGDQMRRAFEDLVVAECAAQPLVLVLEDLAWGDLPSLQFVDAALRAAADRALLVVAIARPEIEQRFPRLWAGRPITELKLGPLTRRAAERLVREMLGARADAATVDRIVAQAGGNAFFLEELIRAVAAQAAPDALPDTVLGMVQARLDELSADQRRVLRAASVFGQVFWDGGVHALAGGGEGIEGVRAALGELVERELVERRRSARFPDQDEHVFRQALVREAAYATLTDADRALGHRLAGAWLERAGERDAAVLAGHFQRGGAPERAVAAYRRAAGQALGGNDLAAALAWAGRGIACLGEAGGPAGPGAPELGALRLVEAEAHRWRGEFAPAEARALAAMEAFARGGDAWHIAAGEAAILSGRLGHNDRLRALGDELYALWTDAPSAAQIISTARAAAILLMAGEYARCDALLEGVRRVAPCERDPGARARIHQALATRALVAGDPGAHLAHMIAAADCFDQVGDIRNVCNSRVNIGFAQMDMGDYAPAERALRDALAAAERLGLPNLAAHAKHNLGLVLARRGVLDEARQAELEAMEGFAAQGDRRLAGASRSYLAMILHLQGSLAEAAREGEAAVAELGSAKPVRAYALATLARIRLSQGDAAGALRDAGEARAMLDELGGIEEGEALVRLAHAEALWANGRRAEAAAAIAGAEERLLRRADMLRDPALREGFLMRVPENARTLQLAVAWGAAPAN